MSFISAFEGVVESEGLIADESDAKPETLNPRKLCFPQAKVTFPVWDSYMPLIMLKHGRPKTSILHRVSLVFEESLTVKKRNITKFIVLSTPIISATVELVEFTFCLFDIENIAPL